MTIREEQMSSVFTKYHLEGPWPFHPVIHRFSAPDHGDPHDHPWTFRSIILHGDYVEEVFDPKTGLSERHVHRAGHSFMVEAGHIHRIVELLDGECWTLILPHAWERKPGFYQFRQDGAWHRFWDEQDFSPLFKAAA